MTIKSDHILKSTLHVSILNATQCRWLGIFNAVLVSWVWEIMTQPGVKPTLYFCGPQDIVLISNVAIW